MSTYRNIRVEIFTDPQSMPTCSSGHGKDCKFLVFSRFGTQPMCSVEMTNLFYAPVGWKPGEPETCDDGYIRPSKGCLVWAEPE